MAAVKALVVRPDGFDGVLLSGPAVRAVATRADRVTLVCAPPGAPAAGLLPHVDEVLVWDGPEDPDTGRLVRRLRAESYDVGLALGGRGPVPADRLLRTAQVRRVGAEPPHRHGAVAALDTAAALGFRLRTGDDGRLRVVPAPDTASLTGNGPYVVVHPAGEADRCARTVELLADAGHRVVVTGGPDGAELARRVSGDTAVNLGGRTTPRQLTGVLRAADALVTADPGAAHLAAAVSTPVVALTGTWTPYKVSAVLLGDGDAATRFTPEDVVRAVRKLLAA
ncbi:glycosyltransferase family 9 protein [Streptomyces sp. NPDC057877]|uniref:glycosyltransferase family 9 protein n=1 Tax=Streptomyces sp. NPDC057877 TaxID=3346269 RepID=UPI0036C02B29